MKISKEITNYGDFKLENNFDALFKMSKINSLNVYFFKEKNINLYYSDLNKLDIFYSFIKNIFIHNIDFYINKIVEYVSNTKYPIFKIEKKEIYITNNNIKMDFECSYNGKIIKINKDIIINNSVFLEDNILVMNISIIVNNEKYYWKYKFVNFKFLYISKYFDYEFNFLKKDIFEIYYDSLVQDFSIYETKPIKIDISKKIENKKLGVQIKYASYFFENEIQKFELIYSGNLFIEQKNINLSIKKNNIEFKTNILTLDNIAVNNLMEIGDSIKKIKYSIEVKKNLYENLVWVKFILNNLDKGLYFFSELKNIQKIFEFQINYNFSNIVKIDINETKKEKLLPVNISPNDIDILLIDNISNIQIKSKKILNFNNANGTIEVLINYSYKNIFGIDTDDKFTYTIKNLCSFEILDKNKISNYIKNNFFNFNNFDFYLFKEKFLNYDNLDWFIKLNNIYINKDSINLKYSNKNLYIEFYIKNIDQKILDKVNFVINLEVNNKIIENKVNFKLVWIIIIVIVLLSTLVILIWLIIKKIKK